MKRGAGTQSLYLVLRKSACLFFLCRSEYTHPDGSYPTRGEIDVVQQTPFVLPLDRRGDRKCMAPAPYQATLPASECAPQQLRADVGRPSDCTADANQAADAVALELTDTLHQR